MIFIPLPDKNIIRYIPQREPIIMVDELLESENKKTITGFKIKIDGIFVQNGKLHEPGLIENIAQTAAAGIGYQFALKEESVPPGFIAAIKNLQIHYLPNVGEQLITTVEILEEVFDMSLIKGEITINNRIIVDCEMKIVLKK
jgi:3-hydroxyacyl-[acyl-carrier-protein] dehydratase